MGQPVTSVQLSAALLRARLAVRAVGLGPCVAALLLVLGVAAWAVLLPQRAAHDARMAQPLVAAGAGTGTALVTAAPPPTSNENLVRFYGVLGEQRHAEQQVKTLFGLAAKAGLDLSRGEYKFVYDKASRVSSYQVLLPVKGNYGAIWRFALDALRALPFASLDEVSFKREDIANPVVEARVRLTLYLKAGDAGEQP